MSSALVDEHVENSRGSAGEDSLVRCQILVSGIACNTSPKRKRARDRHGVQCSS